jgi:hypothetical protein
LGNDDGRIKFAFAKNPKKLATWGGILKVKISNMRFMVLLGYLESGIEY